MLWFKPVQLQLEEVYTELCLDVVRHTGHRSPSLVVSVWKYIHTEAFVDLPYRIKPVMITNILEDKKLHLCRKLGERVNDRSHCDAEDVCSIKK